MDAGPSPLRLLVLSLNYAPEPVGIGPYSTDLAETIAAKGHTVEVVAGQAYYPQWHRHPDQPSPGERRIENGVGVVRVRHYIPARPGGLKRIVHLLSFSMSALVPAIRTARRMKADIVFVTAPSLLSVPVAWIAARLSGAKLWVHVQDFEVEAAFATGQIGETGLAGRLARRVENAILRLADRVSSISPQMVRRLADKGIAPGRSYELRNWANAGFAADDGEAARYRERWRLGDRAVALYSGNIAQKQGIEVIIEAAGHIAGRDDIAFVICGNGPNREQLERLSAGMANVQLHDLQPAERMGGLLALASVHLLPQIAGAADLVLPSKLTNMLISGRPVVATAEPGTGLAAEVEGCGIVTPPADALALAGAVSALVDDPARATALGAAAAERARERWDRVTILARFEQALESLRQS